MNRAAAEELARVNVASTLLVKPPTNAKIRRANPAKREDYGRWGASHAQSFLAHVEREESEYDERWSALWRVALDRGLRREELCGLRWRDVDTLYDPGVCGVLCTHARGVLSKGASGRGGVVGIVERGGRFVSMNMANVTADEIKGAIRGLVNTTGRFMTD